MQTSTQSFAPPAPYQILKPGAVTKERDIKRLKISGQWEGIGGNALDKVIIESDDSEYARARAPHGYALLGEGDTTVAFGDLCFQKKIGEWKKFVDLYEKHDEGKTVKELTRQSGHGNWLWFARPIPNQFDNHHVKSQIYSSIPDGYRMMDAGETQRYGDQYKELNGNEWFPVDSVARGMPVPERNTKNGCYIYCRPVIQQHRYWHINRETGCDEIGNGSVEAPWKSAESAMDRLKKGQAKLETRLFGTIIDLASMEGVYHFDIDEPEPEPLPVEMVSEPAEPPQRHRYTTIEDILNTSGVSTRSFEEIKAGLYPSHWRKQYVHRYMRRLKEKFPTYRIMYKGERLKQGDFICKLVGGKRTWVPCPAGMIGTEVDSMPELCARDSLPARDLESFEGKLDAMSHMLFDALDFVTLLKGEYFKLKLM